MQSWDKKTEESMQAFKAFAFYRDYEEYRDLLILAKLCSKNISTLKAWKEKFDWQIRTQEFNEFIQQKLNKESQSKLSINESIDKLITLLSDKLELAAAEPDKLKIDDIIKLLTSLNKAVSDAKSNAINNTNKSNRIVEMIYNNTKSFDLLYKLIAEIDGYN